MYYKEISSKSRYKYDISVATIKRFNYVGMFIIIVATIKVTISLTFEILIYDANSVVI